MGSFHHAHLTVHSVLHLDVSANVRRWPFQRSPVAWCSLSLAHIQQFNIQQFRLFRTSASTLGTKNWPVYNQCAICFIVHKSFTAGERSYAFSNILNGKWPSLMTGHSVLIIPHLWSRARMNRVSTLTRSLLWIRIRSCLTTWPIKTNDAWILIDITVIRLHCRLSNT